MIFIAIVKLWVSLIVLINMKFLHTVPDEPIVLSIAASTAEPPLADSSFMMTCEAEDVTNGLDMPTELVWYNDATLLESGNGLSVNETYTTESLSIRTVVFQELRTSYAGIYYCQATFNSMALTLPYTTNISYELIIMGTYAVFLLK